MVVVVVKDMTGEAKLWHASSARLVIVDSAVKPIIWKEGTTME